MQCKCGNEARYINERSEPCCGLCPIVERLDSIRISDIGPLLRMLRVLVDCGFDTGDIKPLLGRKP